MTKYKLVPVEPTPEMIEAAQDAYMPFGGMDIALRMALLASPAVQEEPVAYAVFTGNGNIRMWGTDPAQVEVLRKQHGEALRPLYAAPQPASSAEHAWHDYAAARLERAGNSLDEALERASRAAVPAMHQRELEAAAREAAAAIKIIRSQRV